MPGAMSGHPFLYDIYIMNRILIIILLLTCTVSHAQPPETVQHLGSTITTYGRKIISDKGSIWLTGEFNGELITDTQTDLTSALPTVFVARYSVEGIREHLSMIENESQVRSAVTDENGTLWLLTGTDGNEKLYSISPKGVLSAPMSFAEHMDLILKDLYCSTIHCISVGIPRNNIFWLPIQCPESNCGKSRKANMHLLRQKR